MTNQAIPDSELMHPYYEGLLAHRWAALAAKERKRQPPSYQRNATTAKGRNASNPRKPGPPPGTRTERGLFRDRTVLSALESGPLWPPEIARITGISETSVRSALENLKKAGDVVSVGKDGQRKMVKLSDNRKAQE